MILEFEWDESKSNINLMKHGVSFKAAELVFYDPERSEFFDKIHSVTEERWKIIGMSGSNVLLVVCTERNGKIRIISARKAEKFEEEEYFYGYGKTHDRH
jgi:uncharacterized DUF497 family protein